MNVITINKKASFDYEILEKFNAGIELTGHEVKSLKIRAANLTGSYIIIRNNEAFIIGLQISSFQPNNAPANYISDRTRRLLLGKDEIKELLGKIQQKLTIIPLKLYYNPRGLIKIEIAVARGRKKYDKRELIKKRETIREIRSVKYNKSQITNSK